MYFNIFEEIFNMSKDQIMEKLDSIVFNENESKAYEKCRKLIDQSFKMRSNDSKDKVLYAAILYYFLKLYDNKNN